MKRVYKYVNMFFTEQSKNDPFDLNTAFWQILDTFDRSHPDIDITVLIDVKWDRHIGRYVEFLEFRCDQEWAYKQVLSIYHKHYHCLPLDFRPDLLREPTAEEIRLL